MVLILVGSRVDIVFAIRDHNSFQLLPALPPAAKVNKLAVDLADISHRIIVPALRKIPDDVLSAQTVDDIRAVSVFRKRKIISGVKIVLRPHGKVLVIGHPADFHLRCIETAIGCIRFRIIVQDSVP